MLYLNVVVFAYLVIGVYSMQGSTYKNPKNFGERNDEIPEIPNCARNTTKAWCLKDSEYPRGEVQKALEQHSRTIAAYYKDFLAITHNSVDELHKLNDEVYLCPSSTGYVQPLRAVNVNGKWRIIVNRVESFGVKYTQTARIEECNVIVGTTCPLVPPGYESKCIQKNIFHRFLVFDPNNQTFPFTIESFKMPGSCGCVVGAFHL